MNLTDLEVAVIGAISDQLDSENREKLSAQLAGATVTERKNSGAGFFTYFAIERNAEQKIEVDTRQFYASANIEGLDGTLGFILWTQDGYLHFLEGYTEGGGNTVGMDLTRLSFEIVDNRMKFRS